MAKVQVANFDKSNCAGCPHRKSTDEDTGGLIGKLASAEGKAMEAATGEEQFKCGLCGCPLANLEAFDMAPEGCPRLNQHDSRY